jgi:DNA ligase 1
VPCPCPCPRGRYHERRELRTRNGNLISAPKAFLDRIPGDLMLDGELWLGYGNSNFNLMNGMSRTAASESESTVAAWANVRYMVFDAPQAPGTFLERMEAPLVALAGVDRGKEGGRVEWVQHDYFSSPEELAAMHEAVKVKGGEGLMLRDPGSRYVQSRSKQLLKVKSFEDGEAIVIGHNAGTGRLEGMCGSLRARVCDTGIEFNVSHAT